MKKFFFRSSVTGNDKNNRVPPSKDDTRAYWEHPLESRANNSVDNQAGSSPHCIKQSKGVEKSSTSPKLRRTRSLSSAAFSSGSHGQMNFYGLHDPSESPRKASRASKQHHEHSSCSHISTPERPFKEKQMEMLSSHYMSGPERPKSTASSSIALHNSSGSSSIALHNSSGSSSTSSSNVSNKVLDRYIVGEQQQGISESKNKFSQRNSGRRPPRAQCLAPSSPTSSIKDKPRFHSFREAKSSYFHFPSGQWGEDGLGNESPRSIANNVVHRLSQCHVVPKATSKELVHDMPITVADIYSRPMNSCLDPDPDEPCEAVGSCQREEFSSFQKHKHSPGNISEGCKSGENDEHLDGELERSAKEAEERILILSQELEQKYFVQYRKLDVPDLIQIIRNLMEERVTLALEISSLLQSRMAERASAKEEIRLTNAELDFSLRKLEKEKNELQLGLEKELDRRSSDWSFKLEKYQLEEHRLRERVRELAEHNVSLQREVSSFNQRDSENRCVITNLEKNILDLTTKFDEESEQNKYLQLKLSKLKEDYRAATEGRDCIKKSFDEIEKECRELHKSITRLSRTCSEQEKTVESLRETFSEQLGRTQPVEKFDKHFENLKMEQMRLTGVELALRKELESYRVEVDSLRHENINLLTRLKDNGKESGAMTFKLDNEMWNRLSHLQNQGLLLLNESTQFCSKLLEFIKEKAVQLQETKHGMEHIRNGLDGQFVVESEMKVQGFKHGTESLARTLEKMSMLLHEKSNLASLKTHSQSSDADRAPQLNNQYPEDALRSELKAEALLTSLLREKLYSKELEVEQLQAELVGAVRGNDILKCEVQNGMDNLSCLNHKLKDLELQLLKKNEDLRKLQSGLEESTKELESLRDIIPKISKERDMVWEEVNRYREENMQLISIVDALKTKIEALDEDVLLKEGQITILKDAIGSKSMDLLSSPGSTWDFRL